MQITSMSARILAAMMAVGSIVAFAGTYQWSGGDGRWADATKWSPNGVPGTALDDAATFTVNATQTVTVDADATPFSMSLDTGTSGAGQTFSIAPGANLTFDAFNLASTQPTAVTITGGGRLAITNEALWVSSTANNPMSFTVTGPGTVFDMPKPTSSGLYIGAQEEAYAQCDDSFHVTACATVLVENAICIGNVLKRSNNTYFSTRGRLVVDGGSYFYGGAILFAGRGYDGSAGDGCVLAVTNSTVEAGMIDAGEGTAAIVVGSNAVIQASSSINFPRQNVVSRKMRVDFEDSRFTTGAFRLLDASCDGVTGRLARCSVECSTMSGVSHGAWNSEFRIEDSTVNCRSSINAAGRSSTNCVLRLVRTDTTTDTFDIGFTNGVESAVCVEGGSVAIRVMHVGIERTAKNARYEQNGGTFEATTAVLVGTFDARQCSATFRDVEFTTKEIICGDALNNDLRSEEPRLTFADCANVKAQRLLVGIASVGAYLLFTNSTANVTYADVSDTASMIVGREAGATHNTLLLVDSTVNQTGGNVYVGRLDNATNNTLRLVRSTYDFKTIKVNGTAKGDVIVGYNSGAKGNRLELDDHSTFKYDRAWMAVGQNGASNVLAICNGSSLQLSSSSSQLRIGYNSTAKGNRLVMENGSSLRVNALHVYYNGVVEIAGSGNTMTLGTAISHSDGCSYMFRPGEDASDTPMLTVNQAFQYSVNRKIHVDVANASIGRHVLLTSTSALAEPVAGSSVIIENVPVNCTVRVFRSADTKSLLCTVAPTGTTIIFR